VVLVGEDDFKGFYRSGSASHIILVTVDQQDSNTDNQSKDFTPYSKVLYNFSHLQSLF
jgi:hypothetical protein